MRRVLVVVLVASVLTGIADGEALGKPGPEDEPGVTVTPTLVNVTEGGATSTYTVVLDSKPSADVTITPTVLGSDVKVSPARHTFRRRDWDKPQSFTVTAVDDDIDETSPEVHVINHVARSSDRKYSRIAVASVTAHVTDNDAAPGVTVSSSTVAVTEGAAGSAFTVGLTSQPSAPVTITATVAVGQTTVIPATRTFTVANWSVAQSFTVTAVNDTIAEGPHGDTVTLVSSSADPDYAAVGVPSVAVDITDDDVLSATVTGPTVGAPDVTASFNVTINSAVGPASFAWQALRSGLTVATGTAQSFAFTPSVGGIYFVSVEVTDNNGASPAVAVLFTVFGDVGESSFVSDIIWMATEGITLGCNPPANDEFCPNNPVTRAQMAAFLVRALGFTDRGTVDFVDDNGSIFEADIEKLATAGIARGCNPPVNDRFCPNTLITRGQLAAFLVRALGLTDRGTVDFVDDNGSIFEPDIERLATAGITQGCNPPVNDRFCPDNAVTRGQMAAFLHRALG